MKKVVLICGLVAVMLLPSCGCRNRKQAKTSEVAATVCVPADEVVSVKGVLVIGHEVRSFKAEGSDAEYWVVDKSGELRKDYERVVGENAKPYAPVYAELRVVEREKLTDGFGADYDGTYEVVEILKVEAIK